MDISLRPKKIFARAFAYEAMARAYAVAGQKTECAKHIDSAKRAGEQIKEKGT